MRSLLLLTTLLPLAAQAAPRAEQVWSRATTTSTGAAYLTLHSDTPDEVTGFSTPAASSAELHRSAMVNGIMEMRPVDKLPLPANQDVKLSPGGYHVMLMNLKHPLKAGDHFPLTVTFTHAPPLTTDVTVQPATAPMQGMKMN